MRQHSRKLTLLLVLTLSVVWIDCSQPVPQKNSGVDFASWPEGSSPREIGKRVSERFVTSPFGGRGKSEPPDQIQYPETCTWYGALTFAQLSADEQLRARLIDRFEPLLSEKKNLVPLADHVDNTVFAAVPLELYMQTKDKRFLDLGLALADKQWGEPFGPRANADSWEYYKKGFSWQTRMWIDDMFMITAVQAQAYRSTGDKVYIERAAREMVVYLDSLQKSNGLFYHAPDVPFFWGRGNGWMAAGMSELLRSLSEENPNRARIMERYKTMMASLLKYQDDDGMWHQLIDHPESWQETSCSAMFTFAMITGVRYRWLDEQVYGLPARKGWLGLIKFVDENADIREVCEGTGKKNNLQYYFDRKRNAGDLHGQAPLLWCASALLR
jgi:unsaturated rhamnogalacturonyl hydrolase